MSSAIEFQTVTIPARIADLEFSISLPAHWAEPELPAANDDFSDPTMFLPLTLRVMPMSTVVFAVAARPAYENGTIHDWVQYLLASQQFEATSTQAIRVGPTEMIVGTATQAQSDVGPRFLHFAFFEDGGRLVNLFMNGPAEIATSLATVWDEIVRSFVLARPRGQAAHPAAQAVG